MSKLPMKCRVCKKQYMSYEYKVTGTLMGICGKKCEELWRSRLKPAPEWLKGLTGAMSDISRQEAKR